MVQYDKEKLNKLEVYFEEQMKEAEEQIETSSYPPDEQRKIDINQEIVWLLRAMCDEKSWYYKLAHT